MLSVFGVASAAIAVGELGDKTQIVAMALAAKYHDLVAVVAGSTVGMMRVNVPTVLLAERATRWVPLEAVRIGAAVVYAGLGLLTLLGSSSLGLP